MNFLIIILSLIGCNLGRPVGDSEPETYNHHNSTITISDDFIRLHQAPIIPTQHIHRLLDSILDIKNVRKKLTCIDIFSHSYLHSNLP